MCYCCCIEFGSKLQLAVPHFIVTFNVPVMSKPHEAKIKKFSGHILETTKSGLVDYPSIMHNHQSHAEGCKWDTHGPSGG